MIPGIDPAVAQQLVAIGLISAEAFEGVAIGDLVDAGFSEEQAQDIISKVQTYVQANN